MIYTVKIYRQFAFDPPHSECVGVAFSPIQCNFIHGEQKESGMQDANNTRSPFMERVRQSFRVRHYSIRTEKSYLMWIRHFILFHGKRHPGDMGERAVAAFLNHLAVNRNVAPNTQNQALNALVYLYREVLERPLQHIHGVKRAKKPQRIPVVLIREEVARVLSHLEGKHC